MVETDVLLPVPAGLPGYVVRRLSEADIRALYDAREAIEGHAAAVVATRGGDALAPLRAAIERAEARMPRSTGESFEVNRAIHRAIVEAAGNPYLLAFFDSIWGRAVAGITTSTSPHLTRTSSTSIGDCSTISHRGTQRMPALL